MTSNYSTIDVEVENNRVRKCQCHNHRIYTTLYNNYILLYLKRRNSDDK